ncbi:pirin family protein [Microvirga sp. BT688]|uniref:pirin family protein n=1 Tax=Microvirga sp. TaxID=1873136 RepID=UPI0016864D17|nr:pirin family protein [Microvirga sp.]MBD2749113.1 pirin family protein [Microvirga sp.]
MIEHRPFASLGSVDTTWLKARLHFAFSGMGNPEHRRVRGLRVWNDDEFAPSSGFPLHQHDDVEIVTYVREGAITHEDSLGNKERIEAGNLQVMSAGAGIRHSEFNDEPIPTQLFQIWIDPRHRGGEPRWSTRRFPRGERSGRLATLASGDAADSEALVINADARVLGGSLQAGDTIVHAIPEGSSAYLVTTTGRLILNGLPLAPRDGAAITDERQITLTALDGTEIVLVEVA